MLAVHCDLIGKEVIAKEITRIINSEEGIFVEYVCACGEAGLLITGAKAGHPENGHVPVAA